MYVGGTRDRNETRFSCEGIRSLSDSICLSTGSGKTNSEYASTRDYQTIYRSNGIVTKKDGSLRLACDYRYINCFTIACQYPMPIVQDVLNKVGKSNVISIFFIAEVPIGNAR